MISFLRVRQLGALLFILCSLTVAFHLTFNVWYPASRPPLPGQSDVPLTIITYFTNITKITVLWQDLLFGRGLQGSAIYVRYLLLPFILLPVGKLIQDYVHRKYPKTRDYSLLYTSWPFIIFVMAWILTTATVNGIAQAEGWYWAKWPLDDGFIEVPGTFDIATHILAGGCFVSVALCFAWSEWFGLDQFVEKLIDLRIRKLTVALPASAFPMEFDFWILRNKSALCTLFDLFAAWAVTYGIAIWFETVEALHPEDYGTWTNLRGNTYSDMAATCFLALMVIHFAYWLLVPREIRSYE